MPSIVDRIAQTSAVLRGPAGDNNGGKPFYEDVACRVFSLGGVRNGAFLSDGCLTSCQIMLY